MENGHAEADIWQVPFAPARDGAHLPLEVLTFGDLRAMDHTGRRRRPQRPSFHVLALVEAGSGTHRADFENRPLAPRTVVHLRPGVVHQWNDVDTVDGLLILFTPEATDGGAEPAATRLLDAAEWTLVRTAATHLEAEYAAALQRPLPQTPAILRHALTALVLRADAGSHDQPSADDQGVFRAYRAAVETHFREWRHVGDYGSALGYSPRTLSRATLSAAGVSAKRFLDERVTLEAKRLLAHTGMTVAQCARALGFSQAANFTAFFTAHTGQAPSRWRDAERRTDAP